jgi:cell division protein FtsQ
MEEGSGHYRGGAIRRGDRLRRRRERRRAALLALAASTLAAGWLAALPAGRPLCASLARAAAALHLGQAQVVVRGNEYLAVEECLAAAGLGERVPYFGADLGTARSKLAAHPRIQRARVARRLDGRVEVEIEERRPVALLASPRAVEVDAEGRLLPPLVAGSVADLPMVRGVGMPAAGRVQGARWARAVSWLRALEGRGVRLLPRISEIDVRDARSTLLVLVAAGTRVRLPAEPGEERLSALSIVLADLEAKCVVAEEIECRTDRMVVVRPRAGPDASAGAARTARRNTEQVS